MPVPLARERIPRALLHRPVREPELGLRLAGLRRGEVFRRPRRRQHPPPFGVLGRIGELNAVIDARRIHPEGLGRHGRNLEHVAAHPAAFGRGQNGHRLQRQGFLRLEKQKIPLGHRLEVFAVRHRDRRDCFPGPETDNQCRADGGRKMDHLVRIVGEVAHARVLGARDRILGRPCGAGPSGGKPENGREEGGTEQRSREPCHWTLSSAA